MSHAVPANEYPTGIFKQTTADETQNLKDGPVFTTCWKGVLTRSQIYERMYPDGQTCLLYTSPSPRDQRGSRMPSSA